MASFQRVHTSNKKKPVVNLATDSRELVVQMLVDHLDSETKCTLVTVTWEHDGTSNGKLEVTITNNKNGEDIESSLK